MRGIELLLVLGVVLLFLVLKHLSSIDNQLRKTEDLLSQLNTHLNSGITDLAERLQRLRTPN
ncbi:MAG TPA: hypothetical protein VEI49_00470 [Terriglobales bacterium]|nr:hypothetical protein [Terriglobales bacterium]